MTEEDYLKNIDDELKDEYEEGLNKIKYGKLDEGAEIFKNIIEKDPEFAPAYNKLAVISIHQKDLDKAEDLLNQAVQIDNGFVPVITNLGSLAREKGNTQVAKRYYEKAIEIEPEYGPAYNNLGVIYREEDNYSKSIKYLKKARKYGGYSIKVSDNKPLYKEPGCLIPIGIVLIIILMIFILVK